jgi:uncharacterized protein DUF4419
MGTFTVSDVEAGRKMLARGVLAGSLPAQSRSSLEGGVSNVSGLVECQSQPFIQAVHYAFTEHLPLVLSPDDVWLCLAQGFGMHVNVHAEALRGRLVSHAGKAVTRVRRDAFVRRSPDNDWTGVFAEFSDGSQIISARHGI